MIAPRALSLTGCRTKAEARSRLAAWLAQIHRDNQHQLRTDLFAARDDGDIGQDGDLEAIMTAVDDAVAMARQHWEENIGATLAQFDGMLDGEALEPSDGQVD
jgi:hypothetical protein